MLKPSLLIPLLLALSAPAYSQWGGYSGRCTTDYWGNVRCSDSDGGRYRYTPSQGWGGGGRSVYTDPYGNRTTCRTTSYFGSVRVTCD